MHQVIDLNDADAAEGSRAWTYVPGDFNGSVALSYEVSMVHLDLMNLVVN